MMEVRVDVREKRAFQAGKVQKGAGAEWQHQKGEKAYKGSQGQWSRV
jgi:hypothetical protein